jgi:hypothetical protein
MTSSDRATSAGLARLDRALLYACPILFLIVAADLAYGVLRGTQWIWNEVRLAPGFSLAYGYRLYPGQHALAPIAGTLYPPIGHLLYACLSFLKDPVSALIAGSSLSVVLYLTPLLWVHMRAGRSGRLIGVYGFLACCAVVLASPGTNYSAMGIHVDASAVAMAVLATGILATSRVPLSRGALTASAFLSVFSIACKQIMAPVPISLACFLLLAEGPRRVFRYVLLQLGSAVLIGGALLLLFRPPQDLLFNTWFLALHRPLVGGFAKALDGLYQERTSLAPVGGALIALAGSAFWFHTGNLRARLGANRWLVFLFVALFQVPFALRAWITAGGDFNHLGVITLFATLAATVGLTTLRGPEAEHRMAIPALIQRTLLIGMIAATLPFPWTLREAVAALDKSPAAVAFRYEKLHPGRVYFPLQPLVPLLAHGMLTHFDVSLLERADAGCPVTAAQFAAGLPPHYQLVAYPASYDAPRSQPVVRLIRSMKPVREPGLEGWHVFGPADSDGQ